MNQKAFAIFVGGIMILSAFAGFILRGNNEGANTVNTTGPVSLDTFGVQGNLVDQSFSSLEDTLAMCPENTTMAYWLNMSASQNLTDAAQATLPPSFALSYGSQLYPVKIERLAVAYFNNTFAEFHWIRPFPVGYDGIVVPYEGYMMIPNTPDYSAVMGRPTIFGPNKGLEDVLNVVSGGNQSTDKFTLPQGELADLQVAILGKGVSGMNITLGSGYQEFYMGVSKIDSGYSFDAKYLKPETGAKEQIKGFAEQYGLFFSDKGTLTEVSGTVTDGNLKDVLKAFMKP
ncbi:MAG: hypothetical protein WB392_04940 [Methanotrichaceae archaeon]